MELKEVLGGNELPGQEDGAQQELWPQVNTASSLTRERLEVSGRNQCSFLVSLPASTSCHSRPLPEHSLGGQERAEDWK